MSINHLLSCFLIKKCDFRRLLTESPLVEGHWSPRLDANFSDRISEVKESMVGALLWPVCFNKYKKLYATDLTQSILDFCSMWCSIP